MKIAVGKTHEMDYRVFQKVRNGFIAFVFQRAIPINCGGISHFAKPVPALRSLPSVALSSGAVKAIPQTLLLRKDCVIESLAGG